jgi:hypothetical protein
MSQSQKFERAEMDRRRRGHGRVDARSDTLRQGIYSGEVDPRRSDETRLPPIEAQLSQTRSGENQSGAPSRRRPPGVGERGGETLHAKYDDLAFRILENHGAAGADLGDGALDVDLAGRRRRKFMRISSRRRCLDPAR